MRIDYSFNNDQFLLLLFLCKRNWDIGSQLFILSKGAARYVKAVYLSLLVVVGNHRQKLSLNF